MFLPARIVLIWVLSSARFVVTKVLEWTRSACKLPKPDLHDFVLVLSKQKRFCFDRSKYYCKTKKSFVLVLPKTKTKHKIVQVRPKHFVFHRSASAFCERTSAGALLFKFLPRLLRKIVLTWVLYSARFVVTKVLKWTRSARKLPEHFVFHRSAFSRSK